MRKRVCWLLAIAMVLVLAVEGFCVELDEKIPKVVRSFIGVSELPVSWDISRDYAVPPDYSLGASVGSYIYDASGWTEANNATKIDEDGKAIIAAKDLATLGKDIPVSFRFLFNANIMEVAAKVSTMSSAEAAELTFVLKDCLADTLYNALIPKVFDNMKENDALPGLVTIAKQTAASEYKKLGTNHSIRDLQDMMSQLTDRIASDYDSSAYPIAYRIKRIRGLLMQSEEQRKELLATLNDSGFLKSLLTDYDEVLTSADEECSAASEEVAKDSSKSEDEKIAAYADLWEKCHAAEEKAFDDLVAAINALLIADRFDLSTEVSNVIYANNIGTKFPLAPTSAFLPIALNVLASQLSVLNEASMSNLLSLEAVAPVLYDGVMSTTVGGQSMERYITDTLIGELIKCEVVPEGTTQTTLRSSVANLVSVTEEAINKIDYNSYPAEQEIFRVLKWEVDAVNAFASAKQSAADVTVYYYMPVPDESVTPKEPKTPSSEKDKDSSAPDSPSSKKETDNGNEVNKGSSVQPQPVEITPEKEEQVHSALKENIANLDLPSGVNPSTVDVFTFTEDTVKMGEKRNTSSLKESEKAAVSDDNKVPAAVLPEMSFDVTGVYCFETSLDVSAPEGATLEWYSFPQTKADDGSAASISARLAADGAGDKTAVFMKNGKTITTVPADHEVEVAAYFEKGITYAPVIAAVTNSGSPTSDKNGGGCDAGFAGGGALALGALLIAFKRFRS